MRFLTFMIAFSALFGCRHGEEETVDCSKETVPAVEECLEETDAVKDTDKAATENQTLEKKVVESAGVVTPEGVTEKTKEADQPK